VIINGNLYICFHVCSLNMLLAHLAEGLESLCHGTASVVRPVSTFSCKRLLLENH